MTLPSKELMSEVLGYKEVYSVLIDKPNIIEFDIGCPMLKFINIYELAHKCKEWALEQGFELYSYISNDKGYCIIYNDTSKANKLSFYSEPEAVFASCEWILQQKEMK